jgi:RNA polymerase sigma-70 factor (ECF subfamily)
MDDKSIHDRLSLISTQWTLLQQAHAEEGDADTAALTALLQRYQNAVYRYLLGATRSPDVADELFQDFAVKLVRGDYRRAEEARGRFRDFLRTSLINLVNNHRRREARARVKAVGIPDGEASSAKTPDMEAEFMNTWRKALLDRAWEGMAAAAESVGSPMHTALRLRIDHPELNSPQIAERLTEMVQPAEPITDAGARKILQRARELFTDLLLDEVARSLNTTSLDAIEHEIIDLGFQAYCKRALERRRKLFESSQGQGG